MLKRRLLIWSVLLSIWLTLPACSQVSNSIAPDTEEMYTISMMTASYQGGGWPDQNPIFAALESKLHVKLTMNWVPSDRYNKKLNALASSGDLPDVYLIPGDLYQSWLGQGVFLDLKPLLKDYPNLTTKLPQEAWRLLNPAGKTYGIPYYSPETRDSLAIRQDWLDKLHLPLPKTIDDFYQVAKAFAQEDPDGNGMNDTIGFSLGIGGDGMLAVDDELAGSFGLANKWRLENGELVSSLEQSTPWKNYLTFLRKAYAEGVLDKDLPINKSQDPLAKFKAGRVGIAQVNPNEVFRVILPDLQKVATGAKIVQLPPPIGPTGLQTERTVAGTSKIVINAKLDPGKQNRILQLLDYMLSDEGYDLIKNGIEGIHYRKLDNGTFEKLPAFDSDRPYLLSTWFIRPQDPLIQVRKFDDPQYADLLQSWVKEAAKYKWINPAVGLESETEQRKGLSLTHAFGNTIIKIIVGGAPVSDIDKAIATWRADGGDAISAEINAAYLANR